MARLAKQQEAAARPAKCKKRAASGLQLWSQKEEECLQKLHAARGAPSSVRSVKWAEIAEALGTGRTPGAVQAHWGKMQTRLPEQTPEEIVRRAEQVGLSRQGLSLGLTVYPLLFHHTTLHTIHKKT